MFEQSLRALVRRTKFHDIPHEQTKRFLAFLLLLTENVAIKNNTNSIRFSKLRGFDQNEYFLDFLLKDCPYERVPGVDNANRHEFFLQVRLDSTHKFAGEMLPALQQVLAVLDDWLPELCINISLKRLDGKSDGGAFAIGETVGDVLDWARALQQQQNGRETESFTLYTQSPAREWTDLDESVLELSHFRVMCKPMAVREMVEYTEKAKRAQLADSAAKQQADFLKAQQLKIAEREQIAAKRETTIRNFETDRAKAEERARREIKKITH